MEEKPIIYNKLVRDKIPNLISAQGQKPNTKIIERANLESHLLFKLIEESHELIKSTTNEQFINEIADIIEVLNAILEYRQIGWDEVNQHITLKREERGNFSQGVFLLSVGSNPHGIDQTDVCLPQLITKSSEISLLELFKSELKSAATLYIATAFITKGVYNLLIDPLSNFASQGGKIKILTSVMNSFNNPDDLCRLLDYIPDIKLKIFYPNPGEKEFDFSIAPPPFHLKCFMFERKHTNNSMIIGSSNFTKGGFSSNYEWNYFSSSEVNTPFMSRAAPFSNAVKEFMNYWENESIDFAEPFISLYRNRWEETYTLRGKLRQLELSIQKKHDVEPRPAQVQALKNISDNRKYGIKRTAVIAATGLGKTHIAAFDFKASNMKNVLYIAHREFILNKSLRVFRDILDNKTFGDIYSGNSAVDLKKIVAIESQSVFSMIQILSRNQNYTKIPYDYFDYIVVDEFHHSQAKSYRDIINWFSPKFLIGLTATPERMDGRDVLEICNNNISYESRLFHAINNQWLAPFQYFAIYDESDYSQIRWTGRYDDQELDKILIDDTRAELVITNLNRYLPSSGKIKVLAFCSSKNHAHYMNRKFNELGCKSQLVLGDTPPKARDSIVKELQDENSTLQIICSVDVFGEGVDIPYLTHILLLRPTQSFTVFLQQIGRGLREAPGKDFVIILDFVGNFRQSYVARLVFSEYRNVNDLKERVGNLKDIGKIKPPYGCSVSVDTGVQRIWNSEIEKIIRKTDKKNVLKDLYLEIKENLGYDRSPRIMDFYVNPVEFDPSVFIKTFGNWLRAKEFFQDISGYEKELLDTTGERFLEHLEKNLNPNKSYKMVVIYYLLRTELNRTNWSIEEIAEGFKDFYLKNKHYISDYKDLNRVDNPSSYPISKIISHFKSKPLNFLSDKPHKFFHLDKISNSFIIKNDVSVYWKNQEYRKMIKDRNDYVFHSYFNRKQ